MTRSLSFSISLFQLTCYALLLFSAVWWLAAVPAIDFPGRLLLDISDWPLDGSHDELSRDARFLSAIGSGLLVAMALFLLLVILPEIKKGNFSILKGAAIAVVAWYVVDSVGCIFAGVISNVVFNTVYAVLILLPMYLIHRFQ